MMNLKREEVYAHPRRSEDNQVSPTVGCRGKMQQVSIGRVGIWRLHTINIEDITNPATRGITA
jgi:hypothetical protein